MDIVWQFFVIIYKCSKKVKVMKTMQLGWKSGFKLVGDVRKYRKLNSKPPSSKEFLKKIRWGRKKIDELLYDLVFFSMIKNVYKDS